MKLTLMQEKYISRAQSSALGFVVADGKRSERLCEQLVQLGKFVRVKHETPAYALPEFAEELGLELLD